MTMIAINLLFPKRFPEGSKMPIALTKKRRVTSLRIGAKTMLSMSNKYSILQRRDKMRQGTQAPSRTRTITTFTADGSLNVQRRR